MFRYFLYSASLVLSVILFFGLLEHLEQIFPGGFEVQLGIIVVPVEWQNIGIVCLAALCFFWGLGLTISKPSSLSDLVGDDDAIQGAKPGAPLENPLKGIVLKIHRVRVIRFYLLEKLLPVVSFVGLTFAALRVFGVITDT